MASLTAVNAIITLTIPGVFSVPQQLQGFTVDDVAGTDTLTVAETAMGVDGKLSAGLVYNAVKYTYHLQGDSDSNFIFDQWNAAQISNEDVFPANGLVIMKSLGTKWTWQRGFLTAFKVAPDIKKILQPRTFEITWERVRPQPS